MPKLQLNDLSFALENDKDSSLLGNLKDRLQTFQFQTDTTNPTHLVVKAPLSKSITKKLDRKVAFRQTSQDISKWKHFINQNRQSDHVDLSSQYRNIVPTETTNHSIIRSFKPTTKLELQVTQLLKDAGLQSEQDASGKIFTQMKQTFSPEEIQQRNAQLSKMRSVMFFHEQKLKKAAKNKKNRSGGRSKEILREILKEVGIEEELTADQEALLAELERAQQRVSQKSRKRTNYLRELILSGQSVDDGMEEEEELKRKILELDQDENAIVVAEEGKEENPSIFEKLLSKRGKKYEEDDDEHFGGSDNEDNNKKELGIKSIEQITRANGRISKGKGAEFQQKESRISPLNSLPIATGENDQLLNISSPDTPSSVSFDSQRALIKRAFATDNVTTEFEKEKSEQIEQDIESSISKPVFLPGWGSWSGNGAKESKGAILFKERQNKEYQEKKKQEIRKRKDFHLSNVLINEKAISATESFLVDKLPFPFKSKEHYELAMNIPIGKEWNTLNSYESTIKPKYSIKSGTVIEAPLLPTQQSSN